MMRTQHVAAKSLCCGGIDAIATLPETSVGQQYFFSNGTVSLQEGYVSVTPIVCEKRGGIIPFFDSSDQNRRPRCPRASKHSQPLASLQSSQLAAALPKTRKLLLLSRFKKSRPTTSSKIFAGRASCYAPQNPFSFPDNSTDQPANARIGGALLC